MSHKSYADALRHNIDKVAPKGENNIKKEKSIIYYNNTTDKNGILVDLEEENKITQKIGISYKDIKKIHKYLQENSNICLELLNVSKIITIDNKEYKLSLTDTNKPVGTYIFVVWSTKTNDCRLIGNMEDYFDIIN